jgi:hypothetical protein
MADACLGVANKAPHLFVYLFLLPRMMSRKGLNPSYGRDLGSSRLGLRYAFSPLRHTVAVQYYF